MFDLNAHVNTSSAECYRQAPRRDAGDAGQGELPEPCTFTVPIYGLSGMGRLCLSQLDAGDLLHLAACCQVMGFLSLWPSSPTAAHTTNTLRLNSQLHAEEKIVQGIPR